MSDDEYDVAIPFVTCAAAGGPHDDESYAAGWEMGFLASVLELLTPQDLPFRWTIREANVPQGEALAATLGMRQAILTYSHTPAPIGSWTVVEYAPGKTR